MPINDQEMAQIIKKFMEKNSPEKKQEKNKKEQEEQKHEQEDKKEKKKQQIFIYNDPQKDNLEVKYNQTNYQPSLLQVQRDQIVHTSNTVLNSAVSGIAGLFRLLLAIPWKWVIGIIVFIAVIINFQTIITYGLILLVGGILLYSFLS